MKWKNAWLFLGPVLLLTLDISLTLIGQPAAYWEGNLEQAKEGNLLPRWLMHQHCLLMPSVALGWMPIFCAAILWLPARFAKIPAFVLHVGHTLGAASWIVELAPGSYLVAIPFLVFSVKLMDWTWQRVPSEQIP